MSIKAKLALATVAGLFVLTMFALALVVVHTSQKAEADEYPSQSMQARAHASSTVYTLTWGASQRVIATSTRMAATATLPATAGRIGTTYQTINCGTGGAVWLQFNDVAAATSTGYWLAASSTVTLSDAIPNVNGTIRALASTASCGLLVTEYRSEY